MTAIIKLALNEPYPGPLPSHDAAVSDFLRPGGSRLLIAMSGINDRDAKALRRGKMQAGMLHKSGAILFLWRFFDKSGSPVVTLDSPFDARAIADINLHDITTGEQRLLIDCHIVDSATRLVRGLRAVTMPPAMTLDFLSAVQDQLSSEGSGARQQTIWMQSSPDELFAAAKTMTMGP